MTEYTTKGLADEIRRAILAGDDVFVEQSIWKALSVEYLTTALEALARENHVILIVGVKHGD